MDCDIAVRPTRRGVGGRREKMTTYIYFALDNDRNEIASGTVDAADTDAALRLAAEALEKTDTEYADLDVIED